MCMYICIYVLVLQPDPHFIVSVSFNSKKFINSSLFTFVYITNKYDMYVLNAISIYLVSKS